MEKIIDDLFKLQDLKYRDLQIRIIKTVDTVILLVDSAEGVMPQTRFVLETALKQNLNPILFINKK